ncbi:hypothetical protein [Streptomyces sp. NPDC051546]|uniref:hypothetical protein n=1 Tax=Streptomyces sp. NPDC051546 TaxID=3365655 RepID=UPI00378D1B11
MPAVGTRVRKGTFTLKASVDATAVAFSCQPTAVTLTPAAGDVGDALEVLCGDSIAGQAAPTKWTMNLTSIQSIETADTDKTSLVIWALKHDGEVVDFTFKPSPTAKEWQGKVVVVAIAIGGEVGGSAPTSEAEWPMQGAPSEKVSGKEVAAPAGGA